MFFVPGVSQECKPSETPARHSRALWAQATSMTPSRFRFLYSLKAEASQGAFFDALALPLSSASLHKGQVPLFFLGPALADE